MIQPNQQHLEKVAQKHWSELESTLKNRIEEQIEVNQNQKDKAFFEYLGKKDYRPLKFLITANPHRLQEVIRQVDGFVKKKVINPFYEKNANNQVTDFGKAVVKVFSYTNFITKTVSWDAYDLATELNINVCLYCNRQSTVTVHKEDRKIVRPQFDHFFPKSKYPFLALSFYNLIPSCSLCNAVLKGSIDFNTQEFLHPYLKGFGKDACFTTVPSCYEDLIGEVPEKQDDLQILLQALTLEKKLKEQIDNNTVVFKLDEIYTEHRDYVREMIRKRVLNNDRYLQNLANQFDGLFDGKEELYRLAFANYLEEKDFTKRPLAKLTKDIAAELGMLD